MRGSEGGKVRRGGSVDAPNSPDETEVEGGMREDGPTCKRAGGVEGASAMGTSAGSRFGCSVGGVASIGVTSGVLHTLGTRGTAAAEGCWMVWRPVELKLKRGQLVFQVF